MSAATPSGTPAQLSWMALPRRCGAILVGWRFGALESRRGCYRLWAPDRSGPTLPSAAGGSGDVPALRSRWLRRLCKDHRRQLGMPEDPLPVLLDREFRSAPCQEDQPVGWHVTAVHITERGPQLARAGRPPPSRAFALAELEALVFVSVVLRAWHSRTLRSGLNWNRAWRGHACQRHHLILIN